ncbi:polyprenyl synthetase family protein [bacterium]|jgi:octaprenyl-diphosphate synthase|nr:polyprenyl synthetase family protein [bacterium]
MAINDKLKDLYSPITEELELFEKQLEKTLSTRLPLVKPVLKDVLDSKGKRLRPALLFLSFYGSFPDKKTLPEFREKAVKIATAIELLHMASLVHDDIIDGAEIRHNKPSIYSKWGTNIGVVLGVHLYSLALKMVSEVGNLDILDRVSATVKAMCEGEMVQVLERDNSNLSIAHYITILKKKTGVLFGLACECGVILADGDKPRGLKNFGLNLGVVYQIVDDYLDLLGDEETLGKKPGQDFELGEVTLPLIYMFQSISSKEQDEIWESDEKDKALSDVRVKMKQSVDIAVKTKAKGIELLQKCQCYVDTLEDSLYKEKLSDLVAYTEDRGFKSIV